MVSDEAGRRRPRRTEPPLYDARFEHDACGVGFVADADGGALDQVLPLALKGLGALGHRGAFGADGASSDGAGILLPLEPSVVELLTGGARSARGAARPGVCSLFLPRRMSDARVAREGVRAALGVEGLEAGGWRPVPFEPGVLGPQAAAARPIVEQVLVPRPQATSATAFERALVRARRRMEQAARSNGIDDFAVTSASARTVVYKGLVVGARLAELYPDLAEPLSVSHAVFHQRYATNTMPTWPLAQPFRLLAHNGEINTVRGNREQVRGRAADAARTDAGRRLRAAGPLLSPGVSDSASLDEAVELLVQVGWTLESALRALMPDVPALRRGPGGSGDPNRDDRALLAPWDGLCHHRSAARRRGVRGGCLRRACREHRPTWAPGARRDARRRAAPRSDPPARGGRGSTRGRSGDERSSVGGEPAIRGSPGLGSGGGIHGRRPSLPGRARRRAVPARHPDDGRRGPRAALEHG
jgi:glutamate synthase (NADPH/NADH) large chain